MGFLAVDLGTTNIKVAAVDDEMKIKALSTAPVYYIRDGSIVEFDAALYYMTVKEMLVSLVKAGHIAPEELRQIIFTGQAESLVVLDKKGIPLMNAISWMDERSITECGEIAKRFNQQEFYSRTGQKAVLPTWPATKILWLKNNRRDIWENAAHYVLLKDYIVYCLTGILCADSSIATFSFYFDIMNKCYWKEMMTVCGIRPEQLPPLVEPCTIAGYLLSSQAQEMGLSIKTKVNIGTLDHFAGMIGTGNVVEGIISLSTGTVMALAAMAHLPLNGSESIALHYGFLPDTYIFLPVSESGGACLEWFKSSFMKELSFQEIDEMILQRQLPNELLFLPYIIGTNAPEFDADACGVFYGIRAQHDAIDFAYAVMEGVAHLLAKNIDIMRESGIDVKRIIATGGGAKSELWCQIQADTSGLPVEIPFEKEAACLGAAIIGAVSEGLFSSFSDAASVTAGKSKIFLPRESSDLKRKRKQFDHLYAAMLEVSRL